MDETTFSFAFSYTNKTNVQIVKFLLLAKNGIDWLMQNTFGKLFTDSV